MTRVTVVIPAYNEEASICDVVKGIRAAHIEANISCEVIVVVDGATDETAAKAKTVADKVLEHPQNLGYGRSLKTGILAATNDLIAITDADETYPSDRLPDLIRAADRFHMVVGKRTGRFYKGGFVKRIGRWVFKHLSEFAAGQEIPDINSGMRVFRRSQIVPYFPVISAGFSFTTTSTLVFLLNGMIVHYEPIEYNRRVGESKVRHVRDSLRALQIIVEAILRCNPIKMFLLLAFPFFIAGSLSAIGSAVFQQPGLFIAAVLGWCTSGLILAMGFLSVTVVHRAHRIDPTATIPGTENSAAPADDQQEL